MIFACIREEMHARNQTRRARWSMCTRNECSYVTVADKPRAWRLCAPLPASPRSRPCAFLVVSVSALFPPQPPCPPSSPSPQKYRRPSSPSSAPSPPSYTPSRASSTRSPVPPSSSGTSSHPTRTTRGEVYWKSCSWRLL